jgi:hypothetical protein
MEMSTIDPDRAGGFTGNGASWFRATGKNAYAPDGSISWEYRDAYNSEAIWANSMTSFQSEVPNMGLLIPSAPQRLFLFTEVTREIELIPKFADQSDVIASISGQWDVPVPYSVPEPNTFTLTALILLFLVIIARGCVPFYRVKVCTD